MREAWKSRQMAQVWKIARKMAGTSVGPGRRFFARATTCRPDAGSWIALLELPAQQGGLGATRQNEEYTQTQQQHDQEYTHTQKIEATHAAAKDFHGARRAIRKAKMRKSTPPWAAQAELWRCILEPKRCKTSTHTKDWDKKQTNSNAQRPPKKHTPSLR